MPNHLDFDLVQSCCFWSKNETWFPTNAFLDVQWHCFENNFLVFDPWWQWASDQCGKHANTSAAWPRQLHPGEWGEHFAKDEEQLWEENVRRCRVPHCWKCRSGAYSVWPSLGHSAVKRGCKFCLQFPIDLIFLAIWMASCGSWPAVYLLIQGMRPKTYILTNFRLFL